ncbi:MAG: hypothetical protein R2756_09685 [Bacteroidales bacterium]
MGYESTADMGWRKKVFDRGEDNNRRNRDKSNYRRIITGSISHHTVDAGRE